MCDAAEDIKVIVVDDHAMIREGLRMLVDSHPRMVCVGEAASCKEALEVTKRLQPDVILLDVDLGAGGNGLDILAELLELSANARVIVLTGIQDSEIHRQSILLGAAGLVVKSLGKDILLKAIEKVYDGQVWFDKRLMHGLLAEMKRANQKEPANPDAEKIATLTPREREVIAFISLGMKNKQVADKLFISETTVRHHLTSIFNKLDVQDRLELIIFAFQSGLAKVPTKNPAPDASKDASKDTSKDSSKGSSKA